MRLNKLSELNDIYTFQDTIILCKIFEDRAKKMMQKFPYNPRKCTLASSLSGCIHRYLSKPLSCSWHRLELLSCLKKLWLVDLAEWIRDWRLTLSFCCLKIRRGNTRKISRQFTKSKNEEKNIFGDKRVVTKNFKNGWKQTMWHYYDKTTPNR